MKKQCASCVFIFLDSLFFKPLTIQKEITETDKNTFSFLVSSSRIFSLNILTSNAPANSSP